jgi:NhaP-type Na+/H+ or K+/H+ antiporter
LVFATIVVLFAAFLTAEYFSASGVIASVVAAMVFGVYLRSKHVDSINRLNTISVWENLNFFAIALIFLILGSEMRLEVLAPFLWVGVAIALAFLFLVRPITILLSTWFDKSFSFKEKLFVSWVGSPRGTVSAALAAIVLSRASQGLFHAGEAQAIFGITLIVIAITVVITSFTSWFAAHSLLKIKENAAQERYRLLKTELKAMMIAARKLREDWKTGFVNTKLYEEISEKHKEIVDSIEKEIEKLISKNPALAHKDRVEKVRELLAVQVNALEEAFNNKELSERGYRELMEKYSTLLGRLAEIEGEE